MGFKFIAEEQQSNSRQDRFPMPATNEVIHWWAYATPEPAYVVCVVRLKNIIDDRSIEFTFFDPTTGKERTQHFTVDTSDRSKVWNGYPSTLGSLSSPIGHSDCALLCFTEAWLDANAHDFYQIIDKPGVLIKYPFGEGGLKYAAAAIRRLARELKSIGKDPYSFEEFRELEAREPYLDLR